MLALKSSIETAFLRVRRRLGRGAAKQWCLTKIDAGIGGRAADAVGKKLKAPCQGLLKFLCVTHLPQIAAFADQHYLIEKKTAGGRTKNICTSALKAENGPRKWPRMLSGAKLTEASLRNAEQMIAEGA